MLKVMKIVEATAGVTNIYHQIFELEKIGQQLPASPPKTPLHQP